MGSVHGLEVHLGVPVTVVEDNCVGCHQIETQTTSSCRDQEDKLVCVWRSVIVNLRLSLIKLSVTIKSAILVVSKPAVVLEDIKHRSETREDKSLTLILVAFLEELVHELHLTTGFYQMVSKFWSTFFLDTWEKVWVITDLSELDQNIFVVAGRSSFINCALLQELSVNGFLSLCDTHLDMHLDLWKKTLFDLSLNSTEHKRSEDLVQLLYHFSVFTLFFFVGHLLIAFISEVKPFVEIV